MRRLHDILLVCACSHGTPNHFKTWPRVFQKYRIPCSWMGPLITSPSGCGSIPCIAVHPCHSSSKSKASQNIILADINLLCALLDMFVCVRACVRRPMRVRVCMCTCMCMCAQWILDTDLNWCAFVWYDTLCGDLKLFMFWGCTLCGKYKPRVPGAIS